MAVKRTKKGKHNDLPDLADFFKHVPAGRVIAKTNGEILVSNDMAEKMLGGKKSARRAMLHSTILSTSRYANEILKDYPDEGRVIRFHGQYLQFKSRAPLIFVFISDVTEDWLSERQKDVMEYMANTAAQELPTNKWVDSILKRIATMMNVKSATLLIVDPETKTLETTFSSSHMDRSPLKLKFNQGLAGIVAKQRKPLALYSYFDNRHKKLMYKTSTVGSYLAVPLVIGEKLLGVLTIKDRPKKFFREQDKAFYERVAGRLAINFEYKRLIERLKEEYERLATVIANTLHGEVLLNEKKEILIANPSLAELLETDVKKLKNKRLDELLPELKDVLNHNQSHFYVEKTLKSLEGKPWVGVGVAKIDRLEGQNAVVTILDLTAEKQLENLKNDFIVTATHELRTPLTAILGYLSMIQNKDANLDEKQKIYLQRIERAGRTLFGLVEDLLSVLRLEQGSTKLKPEKIKLLKITREIVRSLETKIAHKNIKISLPQKEFAVFADSSALQKIILNLIDNAIKYSYKNGTIRIAFKPISKARKKFIKVEVQDKGVGIPKRQRNRLFEKFYRAPNELSVEAGGTGLGLYITKKFVEQLGGEIRLTSPAGGGSIFSFTVPAHTAR